MILRQQNLDLFVGTNPVEPAVDKLAGEGTHEERGAVFTRPEVVDFILDLAGYTADCPLHKKKVLEPSFGGGDFLQAIVTRLMTAWKKDGGTRANALFDLQDCVRGVEAHHDSYEGTRTVLVDTLRREGLSPGTAIALANKWLILGDFLLAPLNEGFDFVVGNPPYVRQERIPEALLSEYRRRYPTLYDRADLYIPFIERSLLLLSEKGRLGFICSDRWMKNRYGGPLRELVARHFHLKIYVDMVDTPAFHSDVIAYPAITVISNGSSGATRIARKPTVEASSLAALAKALCAREVNGSGLVQEAARVAVGAEPWLLDCSDQLALLRRIERDFPLLEEVGCKVGIGVATGADKAFIGDFKGLDVEPDRKVPLVTTKDIISGEVQWLGQGVINPFADEGGLVDLRKYPRLKRYLEARKDVIAGRHCAQGTPANWYRTIDRITPSLAHREKLLIPDIKGEAHIVYEQGELYPHHNLYYVVSDAWELRALQAVLLSAVTRLFVASYSTKMRGGFLRFQAQYLRRIRLPRWETVPAALRKELVAAAVNRDLNACNEAVFKLYGMDAAERTAVGGSGE